MKLTFKGKEYQTFYADNKNIQNLDNNPDNNFEKLPDLADIVKQCMRLATDKEFASFFNSFTQDDINNVQEKVKSGTIKLTHFSNTNLNPDWIECNGQVFNIQDYQAMFNALVSRIFLKFTPNTGVGILNGILDSQANTEMSSLEFVKFFNSSNSVSHHILTVSNQPIKILKAGFFVLVPMATNFNIGEKIKITINNTYILHNSEFVGYKGNYGLCVCKDWTLFEPIITNKVTINNVSVFGYENYTYTPNIVWGALVPDQSKSYINPANCVTGIGVQIGTDVINGNANFISLIRNGFVLNNDNTFTLPDFHKSVLATSNANICFDNQKQIIKEDLAFEKILTLNDPDYKKYRARKNVYKNGYTYSDIGSLSYYDPNPDLYIDLITDTSDFRFGISTEIFLIPWYTLLASGVSLIAAGTALIISGNASIATGTAMLSNPLTAAQGAALIAAGGSLVSLGQNFIIAGAAMTVAAIAVITPTLLVSESIRDGMHYTMFLNFINNSQIPIDVRQKTIQMLKMYVHR